MHGHHNLPDLGIPPPHFFPSRDRTCNTSPHCAPPPFRPTIIAQSRDSTSAASTHASHSQTFSRSNAPKVFYPPPPDRKRVDVSEYWQPPPSDRGVFIGIPFNVPAKASTALTAQSPAYTPSQPVNSHQPPSKTGSASSEGTVKPPTPAPSQVTIKPATAAPAQVKNNTLHAASVQHTKELNHCKPVTEQSALVEESAPSTHTAGEPLASTDNPPAKVSKAAALRSALHLPSAAPEQSRSSPSRATSRFSTSKVTATPARAAIPSRYQDSPGAQSVTSVATSIASSAPALVKMEHYYLSGKTETAEPGVYTIPARRHSDMSPQPTRSTWSTSSWIRPPPRAKTGEDSKSSKETKVADGSSTPETYPSGSAANLRQERDDGKMSDSNSEARTQVALSSAFFFYDPPSDIDNDRPPPRTVPLVQVPYAQGLCCVAASSVAARPWPFPPRCLPNPQ